MIEQFVTIQAGHIVNRTALQRAMHQLPDGRYLIRIERKNKRSNQQNRYIHGVLFPELAKALIEVGYEGITSEIAKEFSKSRFAKAELINHDTGEVIEYTKGTHEMTTVELNEFIDAVIRFAIESLNYEIPYPNEQVRFNY